jgi:hypothetical protein
MSKWVSERLTEILGFEDDIVIGLVINLLQAKVFFFAFILYSIFKHSIYLYSVISYYYKNHHFHLNSPYFFLYRAY